MDIYKNSITEDALQEIDIKITDSGYVYADTSWRNNNVCSSFSRLYFVERGEGVITIRGHSFKLEPSHVYLIPAGLKYDYRCDSNMDKLYFHVNILHRNGYDLFIGSDSYCKMSISQNEIQYLNKLYYSNKYSDAFELKKMLYLYINQIIKLMGIEGGNTNYSEFVMKTIEYIRRNLSIQLSARPLADRLFVSESFLLKNFKLEVGVTLGKYIDDLVFFKAENLLLTTMLPIREISEKLGFCDQFYFSRRFSEKYGDAPQRYRKRMRASYKSKSG